MCSMAFCNPQLLDHDEAEDLLGSEKGKGKQLSLLIRVIPNQVSVLAPTTSDQKV